MYTQRSTELAVAKIQWLHRAGRKLDLKLNVSIAKPVLRRALATGIISPQEIVEMLPLKIRTDRQKLQETSSWLSRVLQSLNIVMVEHRLIKRARRDLYRRWRLESHPSIGTLDDWRRLFADPSVRFSEIAEKVGLTLERVRQIYQDHFRLGLPYANGRQRWSVHAKEQAKYRLRQEMANPHNKYLRSIVKKARDHKLEVELIPRQNAYPPRCVRGCILLNGKVCLISIRHRGTNSKARWVGASADVSYDPKTAFKIFLIETSRTKLYYVIPAKYCRKGAKIIYLPLRKLTYPKLKPKIDWWQFKDAWHLLSQP